MIAGALILGMLQAAAPESTVVAAPGARYRASGLHRFFLGGTYRDLWATPIRVPVLDLERFAGGLTASERGGSAQTRSLRFRSGDGRTFVFRSLDKDPTQTWPEPLRRTPARGLAEDQISALLPTGALAVSALERAAGLLHVRPTLYALPDHSRLGPWREEFRGMLGLVEERVRGTGEEVQAVLGAVELIDSETLYRRLAESGANQVDQRRFLAARLFDLLVGDWDRHAGQWAWGRFDEGPIRRWAPVPRDRDWAMSRLDGPLYGLLRLYLPKYQSFGPEYGRVYGLTLSAEALDRRLLTWLERPVWDSVVADLRQRLGDAAIDSAVARLPAEFAAARRDELAATLKRRRDQLPHVARAFYRQLAGDVELRASSDANRARVEPGPDGLTVTMETAGLPAATQRRRFLAGETREVRLFLLDPADSADIVGGAAGPIRVRVVRGGRPDPRPDSAGSGAVLRASPVSMPRDWGHLWSVTPWLEARPEVGLVVGGGPVLTRYGFGRFPHQSRFALRLAQATQAGGFNADLTADFRFRRPDVRLLARAAAIGLEVVRFYGFGNETERTEEPDFYNVGQRDYLVESTLEWAPATRTRVSVGGTLRASHNDLDEPTLLAQERPYGSGSFAQAGLQASVEYDGRDHPTYPTRGVRLRASARLVPALFDVSGVFGSAQVEATTFVTARGAPASPTLALRAGGTRVWGRYPFFEGAALGGRGTVRGLNTRRFLGDAELHGSAELRLALGRFVAILPGEWGAFGLGDIGRVFLDGPSSRRWHTAAGGGLWFAALDRRSTVTATFAQSGERGRLYLQAGFHF